MKNEYHEDDSLDFDVILFSFHSESPISTLGTPCPLVQYSSLRIKLIWENPQYKLSASPPPSDEEDESSSDEDDGFGPKKKPVDDDPVARKCICILYLYFVFFFCILYFVFCICILYFFLYFVFCILYFVYGP